MIILKLLCCICLERSLGGPNGESHGCVVYLDIELSHTSLSENVVRAAEQVADVGRLGHLELECANEDIAAESPEVGLLNAVYTF